MTTKPVTRALYVMTETVELVDGIGIVRHALVIMKRLKISAVIVKKHYVLISFFEIF